MQGAKPHITVLMATLNGARYLPAQLHSLLGQTHANWSLMVSDDGSSDATRQVLRDFARQHPARNLRRVQGAGRGATQNFIALLTHPDLAPGMVALADQDDVWLPGKLSRAVDALATCPPDIPAIYAAESILTDASLLPLRRSRAPKCAPSFHNALVQNLFSGHSTALNAAALALVRSAGMSPGILFHDWWLYQLISGAGGSCLLDPAQTTLYRQHGDNAFGAASGLSAHLKRLRHIAGNDYAGWLDAHWQALDHAGALLTPAARAVLRDLQTRTRGPSRAKQLARLGLNRSSRRGTAALWLAASFGKI